MIMQRTENIQEPWLVIGLRYCIYASAFIPLIIFNDFLSPFHFGKAVIFRSLVLIMATLYSVVLIKYGKRFSPPLTKLFWALTFFTLAFGLTTLTSVSRYQSFWGTLERMGGWFGFVHFWLFFAMATGVMRKKENWLRLIELSVWVSLLSAIYGFLQKTNLSWVVGSGGRQKIFGTLGNPALFAGYMISNLFMALTLFFKLLEKRSSRKPFLLLIFLLDSLAVFLTGVRGSVLAVILGLAVFGFSYAANFYSPKIKKLSIIFIIIVIILAGSLYGLRNTALVRNNHYLARYADISPTAFTVQTRVWAWTAGFQGLADSVRYLIFGYGPENFNIPFSKHFNPKFFQGPGSETLFDRAHNQFIEILVTMGIIGLAAYISIFVFAFKMLNFLRLHQTDSREMKILSSGLSASLVAYIIHNAFIFDTTANYLLFFFVVGFVNFLYLTKADPAVLQLVEPSPKYRGLNSANVTGIPVLILAVFLIYYSNIIPAKANYTATRGIVASWDKNNDLAVEKFKQALTYDTLGKYEIRHRFAQYVIEREANKKLNDKSAQDLLMAIEYVKKNIEEFPQDYLPYLYISRSYILLGRDDPKSIYNDLALENAQKALEISPTFVRAYFELAQVYLNKKDYPKALEVFKKTTVLNPEVGVSWWYLAVTQAETGDKQAAAQSVEKAVANGFDYTQNRSDAFRVVNLYLSLNDFDKLVEIYQNLVESDPTNAQYHASFAATFAKLGKIDQAVEQAKIAAGLDSSFEAEAKVFVKSLGRQW